MEQLIKRILLQFPVGANIKIQECEKEGDFVLSIAKNDGSFACHQIFQNSISDDDFLKIATDTILYYNTHSPLIHH